MSKFFLVLTLFAVLLAGQISRADEAADKEQLRELEKRSAASLVSGDFQMLGSIFAEEWTLVSDDGQVLSRQQVFGQLRNGDLKFTSYALGDVDIRIFGDTAVIIGHGNPHGQYRDQRFETNELFTDTFIRRGGQWRCVLSHTSTMQQ